jgi:hypothetical protein
MSISQMRIKEAIKYSLSPFGIPIAYLIGRFKYNNICMFHIGRCGSTVIGDLLGKHPKILWDGEVFSRYFINNDDAAGHRDWNELYGVNVLIRKMRSVIRKYYGFEVKHAHLKELTSSLPEYIKTLKQLGFDHFIVLERKNHLRSIVSYTIARETKRWHIHDHENATTKKINLNTNKVYLEYKEIPLLQALKTMNDYYSDLRKALDSTKSKCLDLIYDDDIKNDPLIAYHKTMTYLNLKPAKPKVRFNRTNPFPIQDMVSNYDELANHLSGTPYEWMLKD